MSDAAARLVRFRAVFTALRKAWSRPSLSAFTDKPWEELSAEQRRHIGDCFAWAPADAKTFDELKLPYKDPSGKVNPAGVRAALARLPATEGIPAAAKDRIRAMLQQLLGDAQKGDLSPGDVHVAAPLGRGRPRPPGGDRAQRMFKIAAQDDAKQIVYGVVMEPDVVDTQGDFARAEEIELACWRFLAGYHQQRAKARLMHRRDLGDREAMIVENYLAPQDLTIGGQPVRQGSWIQAWYLSDRLWRGVLDGTFTGFSIGADCRAVPVDGTDPNPGAA